MSIREDLEEVETTSTLCICGEPIHRGARETSDSAWMHGDPRFGGKHRCDPEVSGQPYGQDATPARFSEREVRFCESCNDPILPAPRGWTHFTLDQPELRYCDPEMTGAPFGLEASPRPRKIGDGIREPIARRVLRILERRVD